MASKAFLYTSVTYSGFKEEIPSFRLAKIGFPVSKGWLMMMMMMKIVTINRWGTRPWDASSRFILVPLAY